MPWIAGFVINGWYTINGGDQVPIENQTEPFGLVDIPGSIDYSLTITRAWTYLANNPPATYSPTISDSSGASTTGSGACSGFAPDWTGSWTGSYSGTNGGSCSGGASGSVTPALTVTNKVCSFENTVSGYAHGGTSNSVSYGP